MKWKAISTDQRTGIRIRQASVSARYGFNKEKGLQKQAVLTVRTETGARGSARRYEDRFRNRHAMKHAQVHAGVHGILFF